MQGLQSSDTRWRHKQLIYCAFLFVSCNAQGFGPSASEITSLPLWDTELPSPQYSGYIVIPGTTKHMFYNLIVSEGDPSSDPLVVSIPGGPGGSSTGMSTGPLAFTNIFTDASKPQLVPDSVYLTSNPYSWTQAASLLYMDSTAGVGYSYSLDPADYSYNDTQAQSDMQSTLRTWLQQYPYFANHSVFLDGGSYSGVFVPLLGEAILLGNDAGLQPTINLEGYLLRNPVTDSSIDNLDIYDVFRWRPLIPQTLSDQLAQYNCGTLSNPIDADELAFTGDNDTEVSICTGLSSAVEGYIGYNVNSLNWISDCFYGMATFITALYTRVQQDLARQGIQYSQSLEGVAAGGAGSSGQAGCNADDRAVHMYYNMPAVREAMHAAPIPSEAGIFLGLNPRVQSAYTYNILSVVPQHQFLIDRGVRALAYSGDLDWQVPWMGTQHWTSGIGADLEVRQVWQAWFRQDPMNFGSQLCGFLTEWSGLAFATVKAAGHSVNSDQPAASLLLLTAFLADDLASLTNYTSYLGGTQAIIGIQ